MSRWHLYRQYLSWQLFSISWIAQLFLAQFWPNFFGALIFSDQNSFWPKIVLDPKFFGNQFFRPKMFRTKLFWTQIFFDCKLFQDNFKDDFTLTKHSSTQLGTTLPQLVLNYDYVLHEQLICKVLWASEFVFILTVYFQYYLGLPSISCTTVVYNDILGWNRT